MTVATETRRNDYTLNGATVVFPYTFRVLAAVDLQVVKRNATTGIETVLSYPADYAVSGVGNTPGGAVTLVSTGTSGDELTIRRNRAIKQETSLASQGRYSPTDVEAALDAGIMIAQQQQDEIDRSLRLPPSVNPGSVSVELPYPLANQALVWDAAAGALTSRIIDGSGLAALPAGRTTPTLTAYLDNNKVFNLLDYNPAPATPIHTGVNNATAAVLAWQSAVAAAGGGYAWAPPGTYNVARNFFADNITSDNVHIVGAGAATIFKGTYAVQPDMGNENYNIFQATGRSNLSISGVAVQGFAALCSLSSCTNVNIRNCYGSGLLTNTYLFDKCIHIYKCADVKIAGGRYLNYAFAVYLSGDAGTRSADCKVLGAHFEHTVAAGTYIALFPVGVYAYFADDVLVQTCSFKNIYSSFDSGTTGTGMGYGVYEGDGVVSRIAVLGCTFRYTGKGSKNAMAIAINQAVTAIIEANIVEASSSARLQAGILIDSKVTNTVRKVIGNTLTNLQTDGVGGAKYGIWFSDGAAGANTNVGVYEARGNTVIGFTNAVRADFLGAGSFDISDNPCFKSQLGPAIVFTGAATLPTKSVRIHNNGIFLGQQQGVLFNAYVISPSIKLNTILDGNLGNNAGAQYAAIAFLSSSFGSDIEGNTIGNTPYGGGLFQYGVSNASATSARIFKDLTRNNTFLGINVLNQQFSLFPAASPTVSIFDMEYGDFVQNVTQNAGGVTGWQCVSAKLLTTTADASSASTTVAIPTAGVLAGDIILLTKTNNPHNGDYADTTKWHADVVQSITDGTHLVLTTGIPAGDGTYVSGTARAKVCRFVPVGIVGMTQAAALADVAAMTSPAVFSAAYTKAESEALRADVLAVRATLNTLLANRRTALEQA